MNGEKLFRERAIDEKLNTVQLALSFSIQTKLHPQTSPRHLHGVERQPEGVQLVEGVGLVASGSQFFTRLGSVFAEEI